MSEAAPIFNRAPAEWYFHCRPEHGAPHEAGGFSDEGEACQAAKDYALQRFGTDPRNRALLLVGRSNCPVTSLRMQWPPEGGL